jgi:hypothetical protein
MKHVECGDYVPEYVFERLRDPLDDKLNQEIWNEFRISGENTST